jgi:hypothetical protein
MKTKLKDFKFKYFPIALIIAYVPFHLTEEALLNFPLWMYNHYGLPAPLSYPHWLLNNSIFLIGLLTGLVFFLKNKTKYLHFGVGILIWGIMNSMEHIVFSVFDFNASPGLYTSILFLFIAIIGFINLYLNRHFNKILVLKSILIASLYWIIPIFIIVSIGTTVVKIFP